MKKNPYHTLLEEIKKFCVKVKHPKETIMWVYKKSDLNIGWKLMELYQRVAAAEQLGYDVVLKSEENGLYVMYVEKRPEIPYKFKY